MDTLEVHARETPAKHAAVIAESGESIAYAELHARSARLASRLAAQFAEGETIAVLLTNRLEYYEVCFAARRAGLYYVPVSTHLTSGELAYILQDSGAKLLFTEDRQLRVVESMPAQSLAGIEVFSVDSDVYQAQARQGDMPPLPDRSLGLDFAYSSGTTGRPKGVRHKLAGDKQLQDAVLKGNWLSFFDFSRDSVYLSPAPLYHAAPLRFSVRCVANGGTVVVMQKFDAERALAMMEKYRVTHSQWVPTMFVRMLALPDEVRAKYDLSSQRVALHAAAPCPPDVKRRMIDWWGPIVWEYYTGSERAGGTTISPQEWLAHPGSVGQAKQGTLHIVDSEFRDCAPGVEGLICFEGGPKFSYHNDPAKTAEAHTPQGWATFGDIGYMDADGYLYLTDRRANLIISGGVNIYPQEAENLLLEHPLVHDVAVIGVPNADFGEEVKAVVELKDAALANDSTADALIAYCREHLSHIKCPRSVDFRANLPRTETGKLLKRLIRDEYRRAHGGQQVAHPTNTLAIPS